jgi:hypothetical protein
VRTDSVQFFLFCFVWICKTPSEPLDIPNSFRTEAKLAALLPALAASACHICLAAICLPWACIPASTGTTEVQYKCIHKRLQPPSLDFSECSELALHIQCIRSATTDAPAVHLAKRQTGTSSVNPRTSRDLCDSLFPSPTSPRLLTSLVPAVSAVRPHHQVCPGLLRSQPSPALLPADREPPSQYTVHIPCIPTRSPLADLVPQLPTHPARLSPSDWLSTGSSPSHNTEPTSERKSRHLALCRSTAHNCRDPSADLGPSLSFLLQSRFPRLRPCPAAQNQIQTFPPYPIHI